jgi:LuxR family maltose regulon positive regulatory protein
MAMMLLQTKIQAPQVARDSVKRNHLVHKLMGGEKLILLTAAAGYGKSTLLLHFLAEQKRNAGKIAWLSLDPDDSDPHQFLRYLIASIQQPCPNFCSDLLNLLDQPQAPNLQEIMIRLINGLQELKEPLSIILEDFHTIESSECNDLLNYLISHMPQNLQLIISSREDPGLKTAKLRAEHQFLELRQEELAFTREDLSNFFMGNISLSANDIQLIFDKTEGWAAGIRLIALSLQKNPQIFLENLSTNNVYILDFLLEEVLEQQDPEIRHFLLTSSIFSRFNSALIDHVMDSNHSQGFIDTALEKNLFIVELDESREWFRYHHLFRELLEKKAKSAGYELADLNKKAATALLEQGLEIEAFDHSLRSQDELLIQKIIAGGGMPIYFRGAHRQVLQWIETIPEHLIPAQLRVLKAALLLFTGKILSSEKEVEKAIQGLPIEDRASRGHAAAIQASIAVSRHDAPAILGYSNEALELLPKSKGSESPERISTYWTLGTAYRYLSDFSRAEKFFLQAKEKAEEAGHLIIIILSSIGLAELAYEEKNYRRVVELTSRLLTEFKNQEMPVLCEAERLQALALFDLHRPEEALTIVQRAKKQAALLQSSDRFYAAQITEYRIRIKLGEKRLVSEKLALLEKELENRGYNYLIPDLGLLQEELQISRFEKERTTSVQPLTRREEEILELISIGSSNQEIADALFISQSTVKGHIQKIFTKLQVGSRTAAAAYFKNST